MASRFAWSDEETLIWQDRHVASAAVAIAPYVLVTDNLKHFDAQALQALGVTVRSPDEFLCDLFEEKPEVVDAATWEAAANLTITCPTWDEYLDSIATKCKLAKFAARLRAWAPRQGPHVGWAISVSLPAYLAIPMKSADLSMRHLRSPL
jgi:hypothetical protein